MDAVLEKASCSMNSICLLLFRLIACLPIGLLTCTLCDLESSVLGSRPVQPMQSFHSFRVSEFVPGLSRKHNT